MGEMDRAEERRQCRRCIVAVNAIGVCVFQLSSNEAGSRLLAQMGLKLASGSTRFSGWVPGDEIDRGLEEARTAEQS